MVFLEIVAFLFFEGATGQRPPGVDDALAAHECLFPEKRTESVPASQPGAEQGPPAGWERRVGGEFRQATGDLATTAAMITIGEALRVFSGAGCCRRFRDRTAMALFPGRRFQEEVASFQQQAKDEKLSPVDRPPPPARFGAQGSDVAGQEKLREKGVCQRPPDCSPPCPTVIAPGDAAERQGLPRNCTGVGQPGLPGVE